jgi:hypothetical protein
MNMEQLKVDWLTDGLIDFEYKKYVLLAYLKNVRANFDDKKLYPFMSDMVFHYQNLMTIKSNKSLLYENFPKSISKADFSKLKLTYKKLVEDDDLMLEIESIVEFAMPKFQNALEVGKEIYEYVESNLEFVPVGVTPIYTNEGYLFLSQDVSSDVNIYQYQLTFFEQSNEKFRGINTHFLKREERTLSNTFEQIKLKLVKKFADLPNPATYAIVSKQFFPLPETLLPIAKRLLVRNISIS